MVNRTDFIVKRVLPDQSVVYLSPQASLTYPLEFKKNSRDVVMEGSASLRSLKILTGHL
ncbi:hypothetical protein [Pedobacter steynii]